VRVAVLFAGQLFAVVLAAVEVVEALAVLSAAVARVTRP
jgi:hypothetical protein